MVFAIIAAAVALFVLAASYEAYRIAFKGVKKKEEKLDLPDNPGSAPYRERSRELVDGMLKRKFEKVAITSRDGLKLTGRYYHVKDGAPLHIQFHGYRSCSDRDFSGGAAMAPKLGYNALAVDQRAHRESEGRTITFGVKERFDAVDWAYWAAERFDCPIILSGISMGAATVLMASNQKLPENVVGIIADCPYSSPKAIIEKVARQRGLPGGISWALGKLGALIYGGVWMKSGVDAISSVRSTKLDILLIHGEADSFVPVEMSREIKAAAPDRIDLQIFPGADHGISYLTDEKRYEDLIADFTKRAVEKFRKK